MAKMFVMVCQYVPISWRQSTATYCWQMTRKGVSHHVQKHQRVLCEECGEDFQRHQWPSTSRHITPSQDRLLPHRLHYLPPCQINTGYTYPRLSRQSTAWLRVAPGSIPVTPIYGCILCNDTRRIKSLS